MSRLHLESGWMWWNARNVRSTASKIVSETHKSSIALLDNNYCFKCRLHFKGNCSNCWYYPVMPHQTNGWVRLDYDEYIEPKNTEQNLINVNSFQKRTNINLPQESLWDFQLFSQRRARYQKEELSWIELDINNTFIDLEKRTFIFAFRQDWEKLAVSGRFVTESIDIKSSWSKWVWVSTKESTPRVLKWYEWHPSSKQFLSGQNKLNKKKRVKWRKTSENIFNTQALWNCIKNILDQLLLEQSF